MWQDGARLSVRFRAAKATFEDVVADMLELNPHLTREGLMMDVQVDPDDTSRVKGNIIWASKGIEALPESIGDLTVGRGLYLDRNNLATLPESFGSLTVGGDLYLSCNSLATLPEGFGSLSVGDNLWLHDNNLATLPASFGSLQVGDEVFLRGTLVAASGPHFDGLDLVLEDDY